MCHRLLPLLFLSFFAVPLAAQKYLEMIDAGTFTLAEIQVEAEAYFDFAGRGKGSGYKQYKRWEYVAQMELDEFGVKISNHELGRKAREYRSAAKQKQSEFKLYGGDWKQLGPTYWNATSSWSPGLGRITSIGIEAANPDHMIVGSPTGGVWKTTNGGGTWLPLSDEFSTIDVYGLEISPYDNQHYLWGSTSGKVFRSFDGGATWATTSNLSGNGKVSRIQFHPSDSNIVYAVSESNGLFRSTNKGNSWSAVTGASGMVGYDVEFKPDDPNTLYFSGVSVLRSTDGGVSFSPITGFGTANNNYKRMAVSAANPNVVYVVEASGGKFGAFYKSTDSGASFTKLIDGATINYFGYSATGDDDKGQAPRNMDIAVHPQNANEVHIGGVHTWRSLNGGASFDITSHWVPGTAASMGIGYNHADINILKFIGSTLYVGTDGGIFINVGGAPNFIDRSTGLAVREFYKIGVSKTNPNVVSGGSQDNGTSVMRGTNRAWVDWLGADGMESFVDWNNSNNLFGTSQYGSMYRSTNQGTSRSGISKPPDVGDGAWVTPFEQDPQVANTIYVAFADVWKSSNYGSSWTKISDFDNGNFNQMKLAPSDNKRIYIARGATLYTTDNGGTTWTTPTVAWGTSSINYIAIHPQNPQRVLVVTNSTVYHSTDAGGTWTNIGGSLPSGTKYCATWENSGKNGIYVGAFGHVSYTNDDLGGVWTGFFDGLPNARVYELEINYVSNTIFACTYGRGLWESPLYQVLAPESAFSVDRGQGCQELTVNFTDKSANSPSAWEWTFEGGVPATSTLQHPTVTFSGNGTFEVRLKTSNNVGQSLNEAVDSITLFGPTPPMVADATRCEAGELVLEAVAHPANEIQWYAAETDQTSIFTGESYTANLAQTTSFFVAASTDFISVESVGPASQEIGDGADHAGGRYLYLDAFKPFRLKSATVYATGSADRTFRLLNANDSILVDKTIYIQDGTQRINLDMDIPQGIGFQLTCISPANLFRNSSGVTYPYVVPDVMQITGSSGGVDYYYYLYDIDVESVAACESERVEVMGNVELTPEAPVISATGSTLLCPNATVELSADNVCPDCTVQWSNGETGSVILVSTAGTYTATVKNPLNTTCGESLASNSISVTLAELPTGTSIVTSGNPELCAGASVMLSAEAVCPGCSVIWSNGEISPSIEVSAAGTYSLILQNVCGDGPASDSVSISAVLAPSEAVVSATGSTSLCAGESVALTLASDCLDCIVNWSNGAVTSSITVSSSGSYSATIRNQCGDSLVSNVIQVSMISAPSTPVVAATGSTALCPGASLVLTTENICPDCQITWSTGETGSEITVSTAGVFTATSSNLCGVSQASNVLETSMGALPDAPSIGPIGAWILCPGDSVVLTAENICPDCTVTWSTGEISPSIVVANTATITASVSNTCGVSEGSNAVEVFQEMLEPAPIVSASNTLLCAGDSILLEVLSDGCFICPIHWSNGATGRQIYVTEPGVYTAAVDNMGFCGDGPSSIPITITANPPFLPEIQLSNLCELAAPAGSDYQWYLDGVLIPGATGQFWTAAVAGNYVVTMHDAAGCPGASAPVFAEACVSGTHETGALLAARVYPNPARDRVFLELQLTETTHLRFDLFAADGRLVGTLFQQDLLPGKQIQEIALPELPAGIYHYRLASLQGSLNGNLVLQR